MRGLIAYVAARARRALALPVMSTILFFKAKDLYGIVIMARVKTSAKKREASLTM